MVRVGVLVSVFVLVLGSLGMTVAGAEAETLGFIVSGWGHRFAKVRPKRDCGSLNLNEAEHYGVDLEEFRADMTQIGYAEAAKRYFPSDACQDPASQPDPGFRTYQGNVPVIGLDLDGQDSTAEDEGACPHRDFKGRDGASGVDNQHLRLLGCTLGYQYDRWIPRLHRGTHYFVTEGFSILVEVTEVDDRENDDDVRVRFVSSAETARLDANGGVVAYRSFGVHPDERYSSEPAAGKIEDGVLTTEPVDLRLRFKQGIIDDELYLRDARFRAEFREDGSLEGVLGYYWDNENLFRVYNDHRIGDQHTGRLASFERGYMCSGFYGALGRLADGHPDPETGKCTSISAATYVRAVPAFLIEPE